MTNTWYFLITDNSTQFPKHSNMLKCVPVLVHQIIVISKDSRLICKNCSVFRICIEKRRKTQKKLFSFFLPLFFSEKPNWQTSVTFEASNLSSNFCYLHNSTICVGPFWQNLQLFAVAARVKVHNNIKMHLFHLCIQNSRWCFIRHSSYLNANRKEYKIVIH